MRVVKKHGEYWTRNKENLNCLKTTAGNPKGIYILYDGQMPLYIGRGDIASRLDRHSRSRTRGKYWDCFSWYEIRNDQRRKEIEALLLRVLPFYMRSLNKQRGRFAGSKKFKDEHIRYEIVKKPRLAPKPRRR
jgi:hypothetical protein